MSVIREIQITGETHIPKPPKYAIGDKVSVKIVKLENNQRVEISFVGWIRSIVADYWEGDYYTCGYKYRYQISKDIRLLGATVSAMENEIKDHEGKNEA